MQLKKIFRSRFYYLLIAILPLISIVFKMSMYHIANPVEFLMLELGKAAVVLLIINLWITPLKKWAPKKYVFILPVAFRRQLGIACFIYVVCHLVLYLLNTGLNESLLENFGKFFVVNGLFSFVILLLLAVTSNNVSVRKLGKKKWKNLHRLVYLTIFSLFVHITDKDRGDTTQALIYFGPILLAESIRLGVLVKDKLSVS